MNHAPDPKQIAIGQLGVTSERFGEIPMPANTERGRVRAKPFKWRDPAGIPKRQWLYPRTYVRKFVTGTVAPGGVGKTGLGLVELLSMVTGRDLLNDGFSLPEDAEPLRAWYWNGEDPYEEMERQVHAALIHYGIYPADIEDRLFIDSGREMPIKVAYSEKHGFKVDTQTLADITATIRDNRIDVAVFDPFVSIHNAPENSNEAMDAVVKALAQIANDCDCAIGVAAHTRKQQPGATELSADDARGGKALVDGARVIRVLNRMTQSEADKAGILGNAWKRYFWIGSDKINLTPPDEEKRWRYLESVWLPNGQTAFEGDNMRVVRSWQWPNAFSDITVADLERFQSALATEKFRTRHSVQSPKEWAGHLLAEMLEIDAGEGLRGGEITPDQKQARAKCQSILDTWTATGALVLETVENVSKGRNHQVYVPGARA